MLYIYSLKCSDATVGRLSTIYKFVSFFKVYEIENPIHAGQNRQDCNAEESRQMALCDLLCCIQCNPMYVTPHPHMKTELYDHSSYGHSSYDHCSLLLCKKV